MARVGLALVLAAAASWIGWECLGAPLDEVLSHVPDDSLFYFQIAWNFPESHRFTYDGLHDTYGFQPLWQLLLCGLAFAFDGREALFRAGLLVLGLCHVGTACLLFRFLHGWLGRIGAVAGAGFWLLNPALLEWSLGGKESALYALLLAAVLTVSGRPRASDPRERRRRELAVGGLCGLLVLSRVNALAFVVLLVGARLVAALRRDGPARREELRSAGTAAALAAGVVLPWLLYAKATFGTLLPTSGVLKLSATRNLVEGVWGVGWLSPGHLRHALRDWPGYVYYLWEQLPRPLSWVYLLAALLAGIGLLSARLRPTAPGLAPRGPVPWLALGVLAVWAAGNGWLDTILLPQYVKYGLWYAVPEALLLAVGFGFLLHVAVVTPGAIGKLVAVPLLLFFFLRWQGPLGLPFLRHGRAVLGGVTSLVAGGLLAPVVGARVRANGRASRTLLAALLVAIAAWNAAPFFGHRRPRPLAVRSRLHELALWTREHVPPDAVLGAWSSGIVTYFSGRTVVSLEGLANDLDYIERGRHDIPAYVRENRIEYCFGPGRRHADGSYEFPLLEDGTYTVEWVPFPDFDFRWSEHDAYLLVRPHTAPGELVLAADAFPFGLVRPPTHR